MVPTTPACTWWNRPEEEHSSGKLESTHPSELLLPRHQELWMIWQRTWSWQTTTTDIKTNMRHIHTSIVSMHLATRGNNKILRTPPPYISSSEEILPCLTHCTLVQLRTNKSPFLKSYLHKVDAKSHPSPLWPLCYTNTYDTHHLFNCIHIRTTLSPLDLGTDPAGVTELLARWKEKLAVGPQEGRLDPPTLTSKGQGSG